MPVGTLTAIAASSLAPRSGRPARALEHRRVVDAARGLFCLADASGPAAYPGYHPALGIDLGLEAFVAAFAATTATGPSRLLEAFRAAHEEMSRRRAAHPPGALGHFAASARWFDFGGGSGGPDDGLAAYKQSWSTGTRQTWLGGWVLDRAAYGRAAGPGAFDLAGYFPRYRDGSRPGPR